MGIRRLPLELSDKHQLMSITYSFNLIVYCVSVVIGQVMRVFSFVENRTSAIYDAISKLFRYMCSESIGSPVWIIL